MQTVQIASHIAYRESEYGLLGAQKLIFYSVVATTMKESDKEQIWDYCLAIVAVVECVRLTATTQG